ncbi:glycosyltransferase [Aliihoeflea aestuarii]|uniref:glycosyltransferase family 4 protein n=1 Tax=Aliihoeflea aestuarii TaxID=453840 RepID=UPI002092201F|nr:glycosyltransferase family 4 protein [Aliihoeflea aestuarii]MCO6390163.1 glycosyltransferase [Aliihoeflea aestuarii]
MTTGARKLLYLVTEDWFFRSHFLSRARAARDAGYEVVVAARYRNGTAWAEKEGFRTATIDFDRAGLNPFGETAMIGRIAALYRRERPTLVHHVALKPILYGSAAARLSGVRNIVNAPVGLGFVFTSTSPRARFLSPIVGTALHLLLNPRGSKVVLENGDDLHWLAERGALRKSDAVRIPGSGVDVRQFAPSPEPEGPIVVLMIARMLADKGVREFTAAARMLAGGNLPIRFLFAGAPDPSNPTSISQGELRRWQDEGVVEWLGMREDVPDLLRASHIVALPSYREGLPKVLLEAMAAGRPIVATDVPGCREATRDGENGLLVPPRDAKALTDAIVRLAADRPLRARMGANGRARAEREYAAEVVDRQTLELYATFDSGTR